MNILEKFLIVIVAITSLNPILFICQYCFSFMLGNHVNQLNNIFRNWRYTLKVNRHLQSRKAAKYMLSISVVQRHRSLSSVTRNYSPFHPVTPSRRALPLCHRDPLVISLHLSSSVSARPSFRGISIWQSVCPPSFFPQPWFTFPFCDPAILRP